MSEPIYEKEKPIYLYDLVRTPLGYGTVQGKITYSDGHIGIIVDLGRKQRHPYPVLPAFPPANIERMNYVKVLFGRGGGQMASSRLARPSYPL
jgi:hypothetical protein